MQTSTTSIELPILEPAVQWPAELFCADSETTGLCADRHGLLEVAVIHPRSGESWSALIDPRPCEIDTEALAKNGYSVAMLDDPARLNPAAAVFWLAQWCRSKCGSEVRAIVCGRNPGFDLGFWDRAGAALEGAEREIYLATFSHQKSDTHGGVIPWAIAHGIPLDEGLKYAYRSLGVMDEPKPHRALRGALQAFAGLSALVASHRSGLRQKRRVA